jgi:hypothetical protein
MTDRWLAGLAALVWMSACTSLLDVDGYEYVDDESHARGGGSSASGGGLGGASSQGTGGQGTPSVSSSTAPASSSSSASSAGGTDCMQRNDPCLECLGQSCCDELTACGADAACGCWFQCLVELGLPESYCLSCGAQPASFDDLAGCSMQSCGNPCD